MTRPTIISLSPDEYDNGLCYNPYMVNLDRCNKSCNTFDNPSGRICVPNKTKSINISVFDMITGINK